MKAIILAAGKGERLSAITQDLPKPMIKFEGKPLLEHNIELCKKYGIEEIFINLHHLPEKIKDYFGSGESLGVNIKYSFEEELLGTAGAVKKIANDFFKSVPGSQGPRVSQSPNPQSYNSESFFVLYGDNYSNYDLNLLIEKQKETNSPCIIAFHYREDVIYSGVAEFDNEGRVLRFIEKPKKGESTSHWVNAGIYLMSNLVLRYTNKRVSDFGGDVFPKMLEEGIPVYGVCSNAEVKVVDTPEMYRKVFSK